MKKKVLIIFGGMSCEHDISIVSTFQCLKNFDAYLYDIILVYIDKNGVWRLVNELSLESFLKNREKLKEVQLGINENVLYKKVGNGKYKKVSNIDMVFPIMHGLNGEDGAIAGLLKMSNIPYVGCDNESAVIGIDKILFKKCCNNLPLLKYEVVEINDIKNIENIKDRVKNKIGYPCIIKPSKLGSSIGINFCKNEENLLNLLKNSLNFDKKLIIEPFIEEMREFNIAIFSYCGDVVFSEIEEPILKEKILTFKDKYMNFSEQETFKNIPANISKKLRSEICELAKKCYIECGCSGVVRIDFIFDNKNKKLYINEINTIPGALALYLFETNNIERKDVINKIIHEALRVYNSDRNIQTVFNSDVLNNKNLSKFNK